MSENEHGMSERLATRYRRTFAEHRAVLLPARELRGSEQAVICLLADAITDINAAVLKLIDAELKRYRRKEPTVSRKKTRGWPVVTRADH